MSRIVGNAFQLALLFSGEDGGSEMHSNHGPIKLGEGSGEQEELAERRVPIEDVIQ